jgi:hypothetical protein
MKSENFIYWLQGFLELSKDNIGLTPEQVRVIKDHVELVLTKSVPDVNIHTLKVSELADAIGKQELPRPWTLQERTIVC